jgi:hypothetical protein
MVIDIDAVEFAGVSGIRTFLTDAGSSFACATKEGCRAHRRRAASVASRAPKIGDWLRKLNDDGSPIQIRRILANYATLLLFQVRIVYQQKRLAGGYSGF